jgi:hypothetical protein
MYTCRKARAGLKMCPCTNVHTVPKTHVVHCCCHATRRTVPQRTQRRSGHVPGNCGVAATMAKGRKDGLMPPRARAFNTKEIGCLRRISDKDNWRRKDGWGDRVTEAMFKTMRKKSDVRAERTGRKYPDFQLLMEIYEYKKKNKFLRTRYGS